MTWTFSNWLNNVKCLIANSALNIVSKPEAGSKDKLLYEVGYQLFALSQTVECQNVHIQIEAEQCFHVMFMSSDFQNFGNLP